MPPPLLGLPPTIEEVEAFLADGAPDAYDRQVERLLASPHYGERWGRLWLDAARYADSDGYEKDKSRQVWAYRDWVVGAFNRRLLRLPLTRRLRLRTDGIAEVAADVLVLVVVRAIGLERHDLFGDKGTNALADVLDLRRERKVNHGSL